MPNYALVTNPIYKARSLSEWIEPYKIYGEKFEKAQEKYDTLNEEAGKWEALMQAEPENSWVRDNYNNYLIQLNNARDALLSGGYDPQTIKNVSDVRKGFAQHVAPIETAAEAKKKAVDLEMAANMADPTRETANSAMEQSLGDFWGGIAKNPSYSVSGKELEESVGKKMAVLSKASRKELGSPDEWTEEDIAAIKDIGKGYLAIIEQYGLKPSDIFSFITDPEHYTGDAASALQDIVDSEVQAATGSHFDKDDEGNLIFKSDKGFTKDQYNRLWKRAAMGAINAIGEEKTQYREDWIKNAALQHNYRMKEIQEQGNQTARNNPDIVYTKDPDGTVHAWRNVQGKEGGGLMEVDPNNPTLVVPNKEGKPNYMNPKESKEIQIQNEAMLATNTKDLVKLGYSPVAYFTVGAKAGRGTESVPYNAVLLNSDDIDIPGQINEKSVATTGSTDNTNADKFSNISGVRVLPAEETYLSIYFKRGYTEKSKSVIESIPRAGEIKKLVDKDGKPILNEDGTQKMVWNPDKKSDIIYVEIPVEAGYSRQKVRAKDNSSHHILVMSRSRLTDN